ncbi:general substrate transporter [Acetobacter pasteurianus NBRC 101655]|uniref:MFS transporter n=1 Tax=Acetobacter pasteurianus TaxID=438 RepID=UPI000245731F|nr:MFS transporter [Acetobacter pasteurianus]BAU39350.1 general substrate transporter [Acetobacter pasteurianus NBRC 101655]CCT59168.1 major facilitator transporter [Acetobacter pasteurianus 386B]
MSPVRPVTTIFLFMLAYLFSYIDRQILALLIGPIQSDLLITDTQFAFLNGLAFSLLYAILGFPLASLSDRYPRPPIIAGGVILWSLATMACGLSHSFWSLFLCRVLVGLGEAALAPAAYSFLADSVPKEKLSGTLAIFFLGSFLGSGCAFLFGGPLLHIVQQHNFAGMHAWQICFIIVGFPGLLLGGIIAMLVHEVPHRKSIVKSVSAQKTIAFFRMHPAFFSLHMLSYTLLAVTLFSLFSWMPAQMMRIHHFSHADLGITLGSIVIICGCAGVYTSGRLIDILSARGIWYAPQLVAALAALCATAPLVISVITSNTHLAVAAFAVAFYFASFPMPPSATVLQITVPTTMRARFSAAMLFCNAIGGLSGGSLLIGTLNDHFFHSPLAIGTSMAIVSGTASFLGALLLFASIPSYKLLCSTANTKVSYTSDLSTNSMKTSRI